jgi:hypothetical protein
MAASPNKAHPTPEFPSWPFDCLSLYSQMARDFGAYAQTLTRCTDAMEAAHAEADLGVKLFADLMRGYFDLALAPWSAVAAAMAERAGDAEAQPEARPQPMRSRGVH